MSQDMKLLQKILVLAKNLTNLGLFLPDIDDPRPNTKFIGSIGRLPAIRSLDLVGSWSYDAAEVKEIWDFSRLTDLKLIRETPNVLVAGECARMFVANVPVAQVKTVTSLEISSYELESLNPIESFLKGIDNLERLRLRTTHANGLIPCLVKHSTSLHTLNIIEVTTILPHFSTASLNIIQQSLVNLVELQFNLNFAPGDTAPFGLKGKLDFKVRCTFLCKCHFC
jgi:hypothetical protein